jgi:hypothetical protein
MKSGSGLEDSRAPWHRPIRPARATMYCIVVRRGDYRQYDVLYRAFGERVPVIWDRRRRADPDPDPAPSGDKNEANRRNGIPASWVALGFVVAKQ